MPLRKQHTATIAIGASSWGFTVAPSAAQAGGLLSLFSKPKTTTTTTTKAAVTTTATPSSSATTPAPAAPATGCTQLPSSKAFANVDGDTSDYSEAPGGSFEPGTASWTLTGGARVVSGNETMGIKSGQKSLQMPLSSTAMSPQFCIDETNPHFRFAYKVDNAVLSGFIAYVVYRDAAGRITNIELLSSKVLALSPSMWQASPPSPARHAAATQRHHEIGHGPAQDSGAEPHRPRQRHRHRNHRPKTC